MLKCTTPHTPQLDGAIERRLAIIKERAGTLSLVAYIDRQQETVAEWVVLRPILEFCNKEKGYEGSGRRLKPQWQQTAAANGGGKRRRQTAAANGGQEAAECYAKKYLGGDEVAALEIHKV